MQSCSWIVAGLLASCVCFGQPVSVGVIGGVRATDDLDEGGARSVSKRYAVGPSVELGLPFGLAVEADAIYRRAGIQASASNGDYNIFVHEHANLWEFPVLLKYRIPVSVAKPFLEVGYVRRITGGDIGRKVTGNLPNWPGMTYSTYYSNWYDSNGVVVGGGVQFALGHLRLAPTVRYTRWTGDTATGAFGGAHAIFSGQPWQSNQNQVDVLLGVAWKFR